VTAFDTLKLSRDLHVHAGFEKAQSEEISRAFADAFNEQLVTKGDLHELKSWIHCELHSQTRNFYIALLTAAGILLAAYALIPHK